MKTLVCLPAGTAGCCLRCSPMRVRALVRSLGILAETDRIDDRLLVRFGEHTSPRTLNVTLAQQQELTTLVTFRQQPHA